jgi:ankyrin repeat protein
MFKRTPLHSAVLNGKTKSVKWLLEHGADVNRPDSQGTTPILLLAHQGSAEIIKILLNGGAKLTPQDIPTLLQGACRAGNLEIINFLDSQETTLNYNACYTALASLPSPNQDVLKWVTGKAPIKNIEVGEESILHIAVENNSLEISKLLIASGADVNKKNGYNSTPLAYALEGMGNSRNEADNFKEMFLLLLKHGADPNIMYGYKHASDNTKILLHELAAKGGCITNETRAFDAINKKNDLTIEIAELLISFGANVNASDQRGNTPLHVAANNNNIRMIKMLVSHGAYLKANNRDNEMPLHSSIIYGGNNDMSCKLLTIETLCSLEANQGGKLDWARTKEVVNRKYIQNKQPIITLIDELERNPSLISQGNDEEETATKILDDTYKSLKNKMSSNDPKVVAAATKAHARLKGTWIVDPEATKEFLKKNTFSSKDWESFALTSSFILPLIFEFDNEVVKTSMQNGGKKLIYHILPQQNGEMKYIGEKTPSSKIETLTVSIVMDDNIKITPSENNGVGFFLWKRVKLSSGPKSRGDIAGHTMEFWKEWIQDIALIFKVEAKTAVQPKQ